LTDIGSQFFSDVIRLIAVRQDTLYKERWQIETVFKALKTSGYNIEDTHLTDIERIRKLLALIMIAFVLAYKFGIYLSTLKPIKIKNHGRKAFSFFKYGLNFLAKILNNNNLDDFRGTCLFCHVFSILQIHNNKSNNIKYTSNLNLFYCKKAFTDYKVFPKYIYLPAL
jgi:hypothetical protein